ncbi:MAG: SDR family oxidoreductase [Mycobacterium sp.]|nr:SDR family oxidoreductase [Mycobacterium sp.]
MSFVIDFTGRTVLITGAGGLPGKGMGRSLATGFAALRAQVVAVDMNRDSVEEIVATINQCGGRAVAVTADLGEENEIERVVAAAESAFGPVDVLVNHAGFGVFENTTETTPERWHHILAVNLTAPFLLSRRVLPAMMERGQGVIVNTISVCGVVGGRSGAAYTAAKHGLVGLTKNIAVSHAGYGIRCVGVCPGSVRADPGMADSHPAVSAAVPGPGSWAHDWVPKTKAINPRIGQPDEVTRMHLFLASDAASFVNGAIVTVDGGWTAV